MLRGNIDLFKICRKLNDSKLARSAEVNKLGEEVEEEIIEKYSLFDFEDDALSFKEN